MVKKKMDSLPVEKTVAVSIGTDSETVAALNRIRAALEMKSGDRLSMRAVLAVVVGAFKV